MKNWYNYIGILLLISSYVVFAFTSIHAEKCELCGLCVARFPNDYFFLSFCAGSGLMALGANLNTPDKVYRIGALYYLSLVSILVMDRYFILIAYGEYYPVMLLTYTTALCTIILLIKLLLKFLRRML